MLERTAEGIFILLVKVQGQISNDQKDFLPLFFQKHFSKFIAPQTYHNHHWTKLWKHCMICRCEGDMFCDESGSDVKRDGRRHKRQTYKGH